ncbi:MAG: FAD binding domain-containing protein [Nitrososphaerales archaeon]
MSLAFKPRLFLRPKNETELEKYLLEFQERARIIAGGTGIYEIAHRGLLQELEALIDISSLGLSYVKKSHDSILVGATTTMSFLSHSQEIANTPSIAAIMDALRAIQPLQVKNVGTIAGSICTALPFFDLPITLAALDARVILGPKGKEISLDEFVKGYFEVDLASGEFVREVKIPLSKSSSAFQKFAITHDDWAIVNCAAQVSSERSRIFFGGVGEKGVEAKNVEKALEGKELREDIVKNAFDSELEKDLSPPSDIRASSKYRLQIAKVIGRRTVLEAVRRK